MAREEIRKENLEVIEDVVEDFEYLYEEEEELIRNRKVIRRYKVFGVLISFVTLCLLVLVTGIVTMARYKTDKVVNKDLREKYEFLENIEPFYDDVINYVVVNQIEEDGVVRVEFSGTMGSYYKALYEDGYLEKADLVKFQEESNKYFAVENVDKAMESVRKINTVNEGKYKELQNILLSSLEEIKAISSTVKEEKLDGKLEYSEIEFNLGKYSEQVDDLIKLYDEIRKEFKS